MSAALTAISAVSKSRISPTRMMFGSWRRKLRSAAAKLRPMFSRTWTWLTPIRLNSTGSSAVMMFVSTVLMREIEEYSVLVLPDPVGPVTSTMPHGFEMAVLELLKRLGLEPELRHVEHQLRLVEQTHDDLLAEERRQTGDAEVDVAHLAAVLEADLDAAVLRQPLLRDVQLGHDLDARGDRIAELHRRLHDVVENAVDAVADAQFLLVRLDVDVARALLDRRHQDHVHQLDDRRFLALLGERLGADLFELLEDLDVAGVGQHRHVLERLARDLERARRRRRRVSSAIPFVVPAFP